MALLALIGACAQPREHIRFVDGPHVTDWPDGLTGEFLGVYRVVDELGEPILGAVAYATDERGVPAGGMFWYQTRAEADADGFIRMPYSNERDLEVLMAPGYATLADDPLIHHDVVTMVRGYDIPLRLVDWMGRPVVGAEVGLTQYCGHRPDFHVFRSGEDGIAWLRGVRGFGQETYIRASGVGAEYEELHWERGMEPVFFRLDYSPELSGRIVDAEGRGVPGVAIGGYLHRGPFAWTDHAGQFRLSFLAPDSDFRVVHRGEWRRLSAQPPLSQPWVIRLEDCNKDSDEGRTGRARLTVLRDTDRTPLRKVDLGDKRVTDANGVLEMSLPVGLHGLRLDDGVLPFESDEVVVEVRAEGITQAEVLVRERPMVTVRINGWPKDSELAGWCILRGPGWSREVADGQRIPVPRDGRAAFWIEQRCFPLPADFATRRDPIILEYPRSARLKGHLVDANGNRIRGRVSLDDENWVATDARGRFDVDAEHLQFASSLYASLYCIAEDAALQRRRIQLSTAHSRPLKDIELGPIPLYAMPVVRVLDTDGSSLGVSGWLMRDGTRVLAPAHEPWHTSLQITGDADDGLPLFLPGDAIDLHTFERWDENAPEPPEYVYAPFRFPLEGPGPWTIHVPAGRVTITVSDQSGQALADYAIYYRTRMWDPRTPQLEIRGLHAGKHQFVIAARGHRTCIADLALADGEQRTLTIRLPPQQ